MLNEHLEEFRTCIAAKRLGHVGPAAGSEHAVLKRAEFAGTAFQRELHQPWRLKCGDFPSSPGLNLAPETRNSSPIQTLPKHRHHGRARGFCNQKSYIRNVTHPSLAICVGPILASICRLAGVETKEREMPDFNQALYLVSPRPVVLLGYLIVGQRLSSPLIKRGSPYSSGGRVL